jgi:hypothetical protein
MVPIVSFWGIGTLPYIGALLEDVGMTAYEAGQ